MNKEFEKIIEKLEERTDFLSDCTKYGNNNAEQQKNSYSTMMMYEVADLVDDLIEIVKQEAEKYNNGWIPCSEKLPDVRQDVLVTVKYTGFMGMHGYWIKTGHMEAENDWWGDCAGGEVIAWQPLPKPFQKGDNNENS